MHRSYLLLPFVFALVSADAFQKRDDNGDDDNNESDGTRLTVVRERESEDLRAYRIHRPS